MKKTFIASVALVLAIAASSAQGPAPTPYAIRGAKIVPVSGAEIASGNIVLRNGLIEAVGANAAIPNDAIVIDGAGLTVYPGLIDMGNSAAIDAPAADAAAGGGRGGAGRGAGPVARVARTREAHVDPAARLSGGRERADRRPRADAPGRGRDHERARHARRKHLPRPERAGERRRSARRSADRLGRRHPQDDDSGRSARGAARQLQPRRRPVSGVADGRDLVRAPVVHGCGVAAAGAQVLRKEPGDAPSGVGSGAQRAAAGGRSPDPRRVPGG